MPLIHLPIRPPRNHIGERVYTKHWLRLMTKPTPIDEMDQRSRLAKILIDMLMLRDEEAEPHQRHATVAATFIMWLGTNFGQTLLWEAKQLRTGRLGDHSVLLAWCGLNTRGLGVNYGWRAIEHMLMRQPKTRPRLSAMDYETIEHICIWLACPEGEEFIRRCQDEIENRRLEPYPFNKNIEIVAYDDPFDVLGHSTIELMGGVPHMGDVFVLMDRTVTVCGTVTWPEQGLQLRVKPTEEPPDWARWRENASDTDRRSV